MEKHFNAMLTVNMAKFEGQNGIQSLIRGGTMVKNPPANAGDIRDAGSVPGWGRSPAGGNGNQLQYSCLRNPMDGGAWWATVHGVAKSQTQLSN